VGIWNVGPQPHRIAEYQWHCPVAIPFYAGARVPLSKHVTFDGFYMRQWDARTKPGFLHVIGAYWRLEF
jgi:hypothetical protein